AATQRAAGAGGHKKVVHLALEALIDLSHGSLVRSRVGRVGILVGPEAVRNLFAELLDPRDACTQEIAVRRVAVAHSIDLDAIRFKNLQIDRCGPAVHDADKAHAHVGAELGDTDAEVSGARFDDGARGRDASLFPCFAQQGESSAVLAAAARIQQLQLGIKIEGDAGKETSQRNQGRIADSGQKSTVGRQSNISHFTYSREKG